MRQVAYNKFIPHKYELAPLAPHRTIVSGTGEWEKDFLNKGLFHQWGIEEGEISGNSVAIVETPEGLIELVYPKNIIFLSK